MLTPSQVLHAIRVCELRFLNGIYATGWKSVQALKTLLPAPTRHLTMKFKVFDMWHQGPLALVLFPSPACNGAPHCHPSPLLPLVVHVLLFPPILSLYNQAVASMPPSPGIPPGRSLHPVKLPSQRGALISGITGPSLQGAFSQSKRSAMNDRRPPVRVRQWRSQSVRAIPYSSPIPVISSMSFGPCQIQNHTD